MIFSIDNYLVNSLKKNDVNFEPIKQYGVPVAILYMPPPMPISVDMKLIADNVSNVKKGGHSNVDGLFNELMDSNLNNKKYIFDSNELELKGGERNEYLDENKFNHMFDKISIKKTSNKTRKKNQYQFTYNSFR